MSKLACNDFTVKYFGYDAAISGVTTDFCDGINVVYAAEKGGKTSFLKALAGIIPYQGSLTIDGESVDKIPLKERDFQMLFDDYALFSRHSARYNLEYPLRIRKVPKEERRRMVESVAELFDLDVMLDAPVYRLNEWLKVALALCRAYLRRPKVLLIDNIFAKLDPTSRREAFRRFMPLFKEGIIVYATDSAEEAAALSKHIKVLSCGYLMQEGAPEEFMNKPAAASVFAAFEEYPSILPCTVRESGVEIDDHAFSVNIRLKSDVYLGKEVLAGVRPKDLAISEEGFDATLSGRFYQGKGTVYSADAGGNTLFFYSEKEIPLGSTVKLSVLRVTALFDALNERTITEVTE